MKRIFVILFSTLMIISLIACNGANNENTAPGVQSSEKTQQTETGKMKSTEWPTNTIYPKPEGCTIIEVRSEDWKNYITVY